MNIKTDLSESLMEDKSRDIITWDDKYSIGIELIDTQHKKLVGLTNHLYQACLVNDASTETVFKESMSGLVEYVRFHFTTEIELLKRINYPECHEHKKQHDILIKQILDAAKSHDEGKKFVPNNLVRTLKDWILGHIALYDKQYALYVTEQKRKGLLNDSQLA